MESRFDYVLSLYFFQNFSAQDRTHLFEDAFSLAEAGELDYAVALNMTLYLSSEKHFSPWSVVANKIKTIDKLLSSTAIASKYQVSFFDFRIRNHDQSFSGSVVSG